MHLRATESLTSAEADAVRALAAAARDSDGVAPLSESFRLALDGGRATHLLYAAEGTLAGYAQVDPRGTAELVTAPQHRRRGVGRALLEAALTQGGTEFWAHGALPAASALAASAGLTAQRELHLMARPLTEEDGVAPDLPGWVSVESFADRNDPDEWIALNAAAFADHPEQGRMTREDFVARAAEPWFDPEGLLYLLDENSPTGAPPIAFHWTKIDPPAPGPPPGGADGPPTSGEVYVVGVHPAYQGRGLSGPLTRLGLWHLATKGCTEVELYVDGDNTRALATYTANGFRDRSVDLMFRR